MAPNLLLAAADTVRAAAVSAPPTRETGSQTRLSQVNPNLGLTVGLLQEQEYSTVWRWPMAWRTVDLMRNDSQVDALYDAISLSVRRRQWMIDPQQADDTLTLSVADDLGLPVKGSDLPARAGQRDRFSFNQHLQQAVLSLLYGFYDFEIVGHIDEATNLWRLDKLAPRPPRTVMFASVDEVGELASITQVIGRDNQPAEPIPAEHLVHYCWGREGANWYGRSLLRSVYREFDLKDRLIKVDAIKHQRNGMGVPVVEQTQPNVMGTGGEAKALAVAAQLRAGEDAAASLPYGTKLSLLGVQGTLPDTLASIKEHNEAIARRFHAMFFMLGQTSHGSRALGETDKEYWDESIDQIADDLADMISKDLVERSVTWNAGPGVACPAVVSERVEKDDPAPTGTSPSVPSSPAPAELPAPSAARRRAAASAAAVTVNGVKLPDRPLRRDPSAAEAAAGVDFAAIEQAYVDAVDELTAGLGHLRQAQIDDLVAQVKAAEGDLEQLAEVSTDAVGAEQIAASMRAIATSGAQDALAEAKHQGVDVSLIDLAALEDEITQRAAAVAATLAQTVSTTAGKAAVRLAGATGLEGDLADSVATYLGALKWQDAEIAARGVLQGAMNAGRFGQFDAVENAGTDVRYYHSALLDSNTCGPCSDQDGQEYVDLQDVEASFAGSGGYALCEGAERCRCTCVLVAGEAAPTLQQPGA